MGLAPARLQELDSSFVDVLSCPPHPTSLLPPLSLISSLLLPLPLSPHPPPITLLPPPFALPSPASSFLPDMSLYLQSPPLGAPTSPPVPSHPPMPVRPRPSARARQVKVKPYTYRVRPAVLPPLCWQAWVEVRKLRFVVAEWPRRSSKSILAATAGLVMKLWPRRAPKLPDR